MHISNTQPKNNLHKLCGLCKINKKQENWKFYWPVDNSGFKSTSTTVQINHKISDEISFGAAQNSKDNLNDYCIETYNNINAHKKRYLFQYRCRTGFLWLIPEQERL